MTSETIEYIGTWYSNTPSERAVNIIVLLINLICLVGNLFFWAVWYSDKSLRRSTKSLLYLNISFFDTMWAIFQICVKSYNIHYYAFASGIWSCQANSILNNVCQAVSMQTLMLVSVERWLSIVKERQAKPSDTYIMLANSWITAIVFTILNVAASGNRPILAASRTYCDPNWMNPVWYQKFMGYFTIVCYFSFAFIMSYCYYTIFEKFRASLKGVSGIRTQITSSIIGGKGATSMATHEETPSKSETLGKGALEKVAEWGKRSAEILVTANKSGSKVDLAEESAKKESGAARNDERQRKRQAEERALIRKFAILVLTFAITWGVWVFLILIPETVTNQMAPQKRDMLAAVMFPINAALTPYLFIFLDNRFKAAAKALLRMK